MPERIQRQRSKGWRMPSGARYVGRPSAFGNPARWEPDRHGRWIVWAGDVGPQLGKVDSVEEARVAAVEHFRSWLHSGNGVVGDPFGNGHMGLNTFAYTRDHEDLRRRLPELRGLDLVCWCPLDQPCHADVLLEVANQ